MNVRRLPSSTSTLPMVAAVGFGLMLSAGCASAQQPAGAQPLTSAPVITQLLTDSIYDGATLTSNQLTLAPGALLTNPHRHPGDLFGYIIEGAIRTGLENGEPIRYEAGEMFYEPRGILHTHFQNASETEPARVLIVLITPGE